MGREAIRQVRSEEGLLCLAQFLWVDLSPQKGDLRRQVHRLLDLVAHLELVAWLLLQNERCVVKRAVSHHLVELLLVRDRVAPLAHEAL